MKNILFFAILMIISSCGTDKTEGEISRFKLTISTSVDRQTPINQLIIETLNKFLETKNDSHYENEYWLQADFSTFFFPYLDIYKIERKDTVLNFYQPTLMEIVNTEEKNKWLLKLAFIGYNESTKENDIKCIYNIVATENNNKIVFSNPLPYFTRKWNRIQKGNIQYVVSPQKQFNEEEAEKQLLDIEKINKFYAIYSLLITYYSCVDPKELFQIKGFDYNPMMFIEGGGGLTAHHNIVFSANNSEFYTHEIVHLYNVALYPSIPILINEGIATYIGGSRKLSYSWHKENLKSYLEEHTEIDLSEHLEPFERTFAGETTIPYMVGALICERTFRLYGKENLLKLLSGENEFWESLNEVGLSKENLDFELKQEIKLPPTLCL